jgi:hypothetical protein
VIERGTQAGIGMAFTTASVNDIHVAVFQAKLGR